MLVVKLSRGLCKLRLHPLDLSVLVTECQKVMEHRAYTGDISHHAIVSLLIIFLYIV